MNSVRLLIVPYGIETCTLKGVLKRRSLLIVPYGIETRRQEPYRTELQRLLIVPYGIETPVRPVYSSEFPSAFNRTLWN